MINNQNDEINQFNVDIDDTKNMILFGQGFKF